MDRIAPTAIAALLLSAPTWARLGLGVRDDRMRQRAAEAVAHRIVLALDGAPEPDPNQLNLHLER